MDPMSHSFKKISEKNGVIIYYTHPSAARIYNDSDGIVKHIDHMLAHHGSKKWSCIFDGDGFELKHAIEFKTGKGVIELISNKYGSTLDEVIFINPTWHVSGIIKLLKVMINSTLLSKIKIRDDRTYSVLEFV